VAQSAARRPHTAHHGLRFAEVVHEVVSLAGERVGRPHDSVAFGLHLLLLGSYGAMQGVRRRSLRFRYGHWRGLGHGLGRGRRILRLHFYCIAGGFAEVEPAPCAFPVPQTCTCACAALRLLTRGPRVLALRSASRGRAGRTSSRFVHTPLVTDALWAVRVDALPLARGGAGVAQSAARRPHTAHHGLRFAEVVHEVVSLAGERVGRPHDSVAFGLHLLLLGSYGAMQGVRRRSLRFRYGHWRGLGHGLGRGRRILRLHFYCIAGGFAEVEPAPCAFPVPQTCTSACAALRLLTRGPRVLAFIDTGWCRGRPRPWRRAT